MTGTPPRCRAPGESLGRSALARKIKDISTLPGIDADLLNPFIEALATAAQEVKEWYTNFAWRPALIEAHRVLFHHLDLVKEHLMARRWRDRLDLTQYLVRSFFALP